MDASESETIKFTGPLLISGVVVWGLFGVLSLQVLLFSQAFPNDRSIFKASVYGMYLLETAQTIAVSVAAWTAFVKGFDGNVNSLSPFTRISMSVCFLGGATVAQIFYAYRIMIISENKIVPSFIVLMSLIAFIAEVVVSVIAANAENFELTQLHTPMASSFVGIWLGTSCACDIAIAACMCFYLSRRIQDDIRPKTQALISKAMRMTIETGALTGRASVSVVSLATFYAPTLDGVMYYSVALSALPKLHSNAMLALLNSRMKLRIDTESANWRENELPTITLSHSRQIGGIENISFASFNTSNNGNVVGSKD